MMIEAILKLKRRFLRIFGAFIKLKVSWDLTNFWWYLFTGVRVHSSWQICTLGSKCEECICNAANVWKM